ncbi:hypothetical protein [Streptomyces misionensis]|uniref:hypothetical protein n=1 Tax=Streptomyces misionensis TaxID=67331 RepID=UPI000A6FA368|nr:hypothetical protein [Streptomyces misionensis]
MGRVAAMAIVEAQGVVTGWSEGARLLTGHPAQDVVGRVATGLFAGDTSGRTPAGLLVA